MCQRVHPLSLLRSATPAPYTACRYWFTYVGPRCCTPDQGTTCSTTRPVARTLNRFDPAQRPNGLDYKSHYLNCNGVQPWL
ncbi:hypothetical protein CJU67_12080 [Escherichia coli]|nr:hypothetical protein CJU67_12080 [Escherichia coli]